MVCTIRVCGNHQNKVSLHCERKKLYIGIEMWGGISFECCRRNVVMIEHSMAYNLDSELEEHNDHDSYADHV